MSRWVRATYEERIGSTDTGLMMNLDDNESLVVLDARPYGNDIMFKVVIYAHGEEPNEDDSPDGDVATS